MNPQMKDNIRKLNGKTYLLAASADHLFTKKQIKEAELILCNSSKIEREIREKYRKLHPRTRLVPNVTEMNEEQMNHWVSEAEAARPMISVGLASFNGEKYIEEQIRSILPQLGDGDELLISDDGSTDQTIEIVKKLQSEDGRIRLVEGPGKGVKQNFAHIIREASVGQPGHHGFLFLADQDDVWEPCKVARVLDAFAKTNADLVVHDVTVVDGTLKHVIMDSYFDYRHSGPGALKNIWKNTYMGSAMAMRESVIADSIPIPDNIEMHDWWIGVRNDLHGRGCVFLPEKLGKYRRHDSTVTDFGHNTIPVMVANRLRFIKMLRKY